MTFGQSRMKLARMMMWTLVLALGCGSKGSGTSSGAAATGAPVQSPGASGTPNGPAAAADSFFAGEVPASVKMKPIKTFAIDPGILLIQGVEGWSGGQLPGYD